MRAKLHSYVVFYAFGALKYLNCRAMHCYINGYQAKTCRQYFLDNKLKIAHIKKAATLFTR